MISSFAKQFLPKSLFGRTLLIVLVPIILLEVIIGFVFIQRHYEQVATQMSKSMSIQLNYIIRTVENATDQDSAETFAHEIGKNLGISVRLDKDKSVIPTINFRSYDFAGKAITKVLMSKIPRPITFDLSSNWRIIGLGIQTSKGTLHVNIGRDKLSAANPHQLLVLMVFLTILLMIFSLIMLRNQIRPIVRLSQAAEAFGKGEKINYKPSGAVEVRGAGLAFLNMRDRLQKQIAQRTEMLSGISHDLKTPLTRLKLALSLLEGNKSEIAEMKNDVDMMDNMVKEFLDFSKDQTLEQAKSYTSKQIYERVSNLISLNYQDVILCNRIEFPLEKKFLIRPASLDRALQNILDNSLRFGSKVVLEVYISQKQKNLNLSVHDNGPGIPKDSYDLAIQPFNTLDKSRNQNSHGGVGLGLSISRDICTSHGGTLTLDKSQILGGLLVNLMFPSN